MYKELEKYRTGEKIKTACVICGANNRQEIDLYLDEYKANLGDLLNDFIEHKNKPFWKRKYYHNDLTKIYIKFLNKMKFVHGF